tara:strand:+ start:92449 stop:94047 length:1599 start_codon:yes stop_codon:yes gene_type:complete
MLFRILWGRNYLFSALVVYIVIFTSNPAVSQNEKESYYLLDSADIHIVANPELAQRYLDSVQTPFTETINGRIGEYYLFKALLNDKENEQAKLYLNYLQALKYGEKEKNYNVAGQASLELFTNIYLINRDTSAYKYLESAEKFYSLAENENGLTEVLQMPAYVEFLNDNYDASNKLILENIDTYRAIKDDAYYHLFAVFMLASNYIHMGDLNNGNKYLKEFRSLKSNPTIAAYNYNFYEVTLNVCTAAIYREKKQMDSAFSYLEKASRLRGVMGFPTTEEYFSTYSKAYKYVNQDSLSSIYLDSLKNFQSKMLSDTMDASLEINTFLIESEENLKEEAQAKVLNRNISIVLVLLLIAGGVVFFVRDSKLKRKLTGFINQNKKLTHLKSSNEKLKVKSIGLEEYIVELKKKIKKIAVSEDLESQRIRIKELYKTLQIESPTIIDTSENHLDLMRNLDLEFFEALRSEYPELNDQDIIICHHLYVGFKNKEIAIFLNRTVRAIESQRYRISKKMNLDKKEVTLLEHLNSMFATN